MEATSVSSSSSSSASDSSSSPGEQQQPLLELPAPRHHSYLPSRNLGIVATDPQTTTFDSINHKQHLDHLVTIELPHVVLFPGVSLPILISDRSLAQQILNRQVVYLGVLCWQSPSDDNDASWARAGWGQVRLRRFSQQLIQELADGFDDADEDDDDSIVMNDHDGDDIYDERRNGLEAHRPPSNHPQQQIPPDPYIGRIGTIAKVLYTHQDDDSSDTDAYQPFHSLFITAIGLSRFQILEHGGTADPNNHNVLFSTKYFRVQEIREAPLKRPLVQHLPRVAVSSYGKSHESDLYRLAMVSPMPLFVLRKLWLWTFATKIRDAMQQSPDLQGLGDDPANCSPTGTATMEPVAFSYWLAANLPLTIGEKVNVLSMISALERLQFILRKVQAATPRIWCQSCRAMVANSSEMFTVSGAEGTTGNYINRYGAVHQTITVRKLSMRVHYQGGPETQDSWFPGYSWTIINCRSCRHHLGWRFNIVQGDTSPNRPKSFFGLAAGNVTTRGRNQVGS